ncbi:hypothetical protein CL614_04570 [archaeon]|nr:hypothetical protein [archaeon]|tara:strand:+ start:704 stop:1291 length:588 start_codon:yes stop_codon:yes gene_type:complete
MSVTNKFPNSSSTFVTTADTSRHLIAPAQDCSGFLLVLSLHQILDGQDPNQITNMSITLDVIQHSDGSTTIYTDDTDYDIDYYNDELIYGVFITHAFTSGYYTIRYKVSGDNIDTIYVDKKIKVDCNCCLNNALKKLHSLECNECDDEYRRNFLKVYALSKAIEFAPHNTNKTMVVRAIKLRDALCNKLCNCKDC